MKAKKAEKVEEAKIIEIYKNPVFIKDKDKFGNNLRGLSQIYSRGIEFSLLDNKLKGIHIPILCKDYLQDIFWVERQSKIQEKVVDIIQYGFKWSSDNEYNLLNQEELIISIRDKNKKLGEYKNELQRFLNEVEESFNFKKSKVYISKDNIYLTIYFSKEWASKPCLISLFSLFLRVGLSYKKKYKTIMDFLEEIYIDSKKFTNVAELLSDKDKSYIAISLPLIKYLLKGKEIKQNYEDYLNSSDIHNHSGINSFFQMNLTNRLEVVENE